MGCHSGSSSDGSCGKSNCFIVVMMRVEGWGISSRNGQCGGSGDGIGYY